MDNHQILQILRSSLWSPHSKVIIRHADFISLMEMAEKQTVVGLVLDGISGFEETDAPKNILFQYIGIVETIKQRNMLMNKELATFSTMCRRYSVDYMVIKGQLLASLYIQPELRMSGDIDFLIKEKYATCRQKIETMMGVNIPESLAEKETVFNRGDYIYELHTALIDFGSKKNLRYWEDLMNMTWENPYYESIGGVDIRTLPPTINATYLFVHLFFHFIRGGIGLRQLCDWAIYLNHYNSEIDRMELCEILSNLQMEYAYRAFGCILVDELGLPSTIFPLELNDSDRRWKHDILNTIFNGGNFGRENHKAVSKFIFKFETFWMILKNCIKYYRLAPRELRTMIPKVIGINLKLFFKNSIKGTK